MQIIDAQVHAYEGNHPGRPWVGHLHGAPSATGDEMVSAMDAVGVDGALLVSPYSCTATIPATPWRWVLRIPADSG
jgi:L-fuconolactonase